MTIHVVTDSTGDIPEEIAANLGITIIPAYVNIDDRSYLDGVELSRAAFYEALPSFTSPPTTAAPGPGTFSEIYSQLAAQGVAEILSIHVAGTWSGMINTARLGAEAASQVKVTIFDSQQLTMGLGLLAISAAQAAKAGRSMTDIVAMLDRLVKRTYVFAVLDTLEYLRRSGRVNWAEFGIGTLLRIKPLLKVYMGQVEIVERVRTSKRAVDRLFELVTELGPMRDVALLHTHALDRIDTFAEEARQLYREASGPAEVTPAIGAHVGPGAVGLACITAQE